MDFSQVDTSFDNWARENNLQVFKMYKDYEVRSVDIVKSSQSKWQLWLEPKSELKKCTIKYWNYGDQKHEITVPVSELKSTLELIHKTILSKKGWKGVNT